MQVRSEQLTLCRKPVPVLESSRATTAPPNDGWTVAGKEYDSVALCKSVDPGPDSMPATYHWKEEPSPGAAALVGVSLGGSFGSLLGLMIPQRPELQGLQIALCGIAGSALVGGLLYRWDKASCEPSIDGLLLKDSVSGHLLFQPDRRGAAVDVHEYAKAPAATEAGQEQWWLSIQELDSAYTAGYGGQSGVDEF